MGFTEAQSRQADLFSTAAVPERSVALDVCVASTVQRRLQNGALWTRPTDLSWHFPILGTIRELPLKNYPVGNHTRS